MLPYSACVGDGQISEAEIRLRFWSLSQLDALAFLCQNVAYDDFWILRIGDYVDDNWAANLETLYQKFGLPAPNMVGESGHVEPQALGKRFYSEWNVTRLSVLEQHTITEKKMQLKMARGKDAEGKAENYVLEVRSESWSAIDSNVSKILLQDNISMAVLRILRYDTQRIGAREPFPSKKIVCEEVGALASQLWPAFAPPKSRGAR